MSGKTDNGSLHYAFSRRERQTNETSLNNDEANSDDDAAVCPRDGTWHTWIKFGVEQPSHHSCGSGLAATGLEGEDPIGRGSLRPEQPFRRSP